MKAEKYLFALWAGFLVYASLAIVFGATGFYAHRQLVKEQKEQEANIENLKLVNRDLENTVNVLLYDKDTLTVYAREQGYASPAERFLRIVGLGVSRKTKTSAGEVFFAAEPQYIADKTLRIIAFCTGLTIFFCVCVFDFLKKLRERSGRL